MKICPKCNASFSDNELYFCQNDGELLVIATQRPNPTVFAESTRVTNQNWNAYQQNPDWQNQQIIQNPTINAPYQIVGQNQTLATASLIMGILSVLLMCCWGLGLPIGIGAIVTGYLGYQKTESDPMKYGGQGLAIAGIAMGAISSLVAIGFFILLIFSS
jgi:hypothetical protein